MSLREFQSALAELFTSSQARTLFANDRAAFALRFRLDARDRFQLDALEQTVITSFAATLLRKRQLEAARLLPRTRALLGETFAAAFENWAEDTVLTEGSGRYARDAREFCGFLLRTRMVSRSDRSVVSSELRALR